MFTGLIVFSFIFAVIFSSILMSFNRRGPGPWFGFIFFFLIIFFLLWAAGPWIRPVGPIHLGIAWFPLLAFGLIISLLIGAVVPPTRKTPRNRGGDELTTGEAEDSAKLAVGFVFWFLIAGLIILIIVNAF